MNTEFHQIISEKYDWTKFKEMVTNQWGKDHDKEFEEATGIKFEFLESERSVGSGDYDGYTWRWKLNDRFFEVEGYYSSWDGYELENAQDFYEVVPEQVLVTIYKRKE